MNNHHGTFDTPPRPLTYGLITSSQPISSAFARLHPQTPLFDILQEKQRDYGRITLINIFAHLPNKRNKLRGIKPKEIKRAKLSTFNSNFGVHFQIKTNKIKVL